ncbi:MAG: hypothetical protein HRT90_10830, partial [Candidatus Margulisbacteria bacterium]|nr:hypothetical protein [Candidatus Margulisiibacteriota bacterium]
MSQDNNDTLLSSVKNSLRTCFQYCLNKPVVVLILFLVLALIVSIYPLYRITPALFESAAVEDATLFSKAIREFRTLYTSEVVARVKKYSDMKVTHEYEHTP